MILTAWMAHPRKLIRHAVVALLASANTAAGSRVFGTRVEPYTPGQCPALAVYTTGEDTDEASAETAAIELTRHLKLEVAGVVEHRDSYTADDQMDDLAEQVEAAMASSYYLALPFAITAVDHVTGNITVPSHGIDMPGNPVAIRVAAGGALPGGAPTFEVWPIVVDDDTIQLAGSLEDALAGNALTYSSDGTLPLQLLIGTVVDQLLESTEIQVLEENGKSDPLVGIVTLTYAITYRTSPATPTDLEDFDTADVQQAPVGGVDDTPVVEDTFTARTP